VKLWPHPAVDFDNLLRGHPRPFDDPGARKFRNSHNAGGVMARSLQDRRVVQPLGETAVFRAVDMIEVVDGEYIVCGAEQWGVVARRKEQVVPSEFAKHALEPPRVER